MTRKARSPITRLRGWLLLGLVLVAGSIAGLFFFGRAGRDVNEPTQGPTAIPSGSAGENLALIGKDFDYTFTEGEKPLFRIRGESIKADRQETIYLDKVGLTLYDKAGSAYEIESERASFNRLQNEGRLEGKVRLRGPDGLTLASPLLLLQDRGQTLVCPRPVDLGYGGKYVVTAKFLRVHLPQDLYVLAGDVVLRSVPGITPAIGLNADRVVYERKERRLRIEGRVELARGADRVRTQIINAFLTPDERGAVYLRAVLDVAGTHFGASGSAGARVDFSGKTLGLLTPPNDAAAREIELEGTPLAAATLASTGGGLVRRLTARRIEGRMVDGSLKTARAIAGVDLVETPVGGRAAANAATRTAHSRGALATFGPDGRIAEAVMNEEVRFTDGKTKAAGQRALLQLDAGTGEFFGSPVEVENERGRVTAPHAVWEREANLLRFDGGVRALLTRADDADLTGSALGDGKGPLWVEAREGFYRGAPKSFLFRNNVRAWRGKDLLITDELRGDAATPPNATTATNANSAGDRLNAKGNVRTLWVPEKQAGDKESREPIEVFASELNYLRDGGRIEYHGGVRVLQAGRTLQCKDLVVDLNADKKAEKMNCSGDAKLNDPKTGKKISGETAIYRVADRVIEISGSPVQMRDKDNNQIQGKQVVYWVDGGKVEVRGRAGAVPATAPPLGGDGGNSRNGRDGREGGEATP